MRKQKIKLTDKSSNENPHNENADYRDYLIGNYRRGKISGISILYEKQSTTIFNFYLLFQ